MVSGYAYDSVGIEGNQSYLSQVGAFLSMVEGPWIYAADHNVEPHELLASVWLGTIGGRIVAPHEITCRVGGGKTFDYFVVSHHFGEDAWAEVRATSLVWPHFPVVLHFKGINMSQCVTVRHKPAPFPLPPPIGPRCVQDRACWGWSAGDLADIADRVPEQH